MMHQILCLLFVYLMVKGSKIAIVIKKMFIKNFYYYTVKNCLNTQQTNI